MSARVQLVPPVAPAVPVPIAAPIATAVHHRPIRTYYYASTSDSAGDWVRRSRASTLHNAIRAAIMHVLQKTAAMADFYDEDGVRIGYVKRMGPRKIEVFHTNFTQLH